MQQADTLTKCEKIVRITTEVSILPLKMIFLSFLYSNRKQEGYYDDISPQTLYLEQTMAIPEGVSTNPKAKVVPRAQELLPLHLVKDTAYVGKIKHPPSLQERSLEESSNHKNYDTAADQEMSPAQPSSGKPTLQQEPSSFDGNKCEWESEYSKLSYEHMENHPIIKNQAFTLED